MDNDMNLSVPEDETPQELSGGFDYSTVDDDTAEFLKDKAARIKDETSNFATAVGEALTEAQERLAAYNIGTFEAWYASLGFKKTTVYRLINRYGMVIRSNVGTNGTLLEELPVSLTYAISEPSAPPELVQQVLDGDITTHAEYKRLKEQLDAERERAEKAEKEAEDYEFHYKNVHASYERLEAVNSKHYEELKEAVDEAEDLRRQLRELESQPADVAVESVSDAQLAEIRSDEEKKAAEVFAPQKERLEHQLQEAEERLAELEESAKVAADFSSCFPMAKDGAHTIRTLGKVFMMIARDLNYTDFKQCAELTIEAAGETRATLMAAVEQKRVAEELGEEVDDFDF